MIQKKMISQRDAYWDRIYDLAKEDRDIVLVIADMGAPALDKFRRDMSAQYLDVGIAEQQALGLAAGLAKCGKKPLAYAIAPFITLRCYEHIRIEMSMMKLPVTLVGVGSGMSYDDSGPTHHAVDDLSALRIFPRMKIHNITDAVMARAFADISVHAEYPKYIRLDRGVLAPVYSEGHDFSAGLTTLSDGDDVALVATGNMVQRALEVSESLAQKGIGARIIDVYTLPVADELLIDAIGDIQQVVTLEEHNLVGGFGSMVCEVLADAQVHKNIKRIGMDFSAGYCYRYGGRELMQSYYGLDRASIEETVLALSPKQRTFSLS